MAEENQLLDPQVLSRLMHLPLLARRAMEGSVSGQHKSPHRGSSVEFAEYRNYVPGDDIRRLDWRVFARTDRFFLKEFEAETNLRCYFVLDCSGSMKFGKAGGGEAGLRPAHGRHPRLIWPRARATPWGWSAPRRRRSSKSRRGAIPPT